MKEDEILDYLNAEGGKFWDDQFFKLYEEFIEACLNPEAHPEWKISESERQRVLKSIKKIKK